MACCLGNRILAPETLGTKTSRFVIFGGEYPADLYFHELNPPGVREEIG